MLNRTLFCYFLYVASYITACSISSGDFNVCALESTKKALPYIFKGDKKYKVMTTDPVQISRIDIDAGPNLQIAFNDVTATGLTQIEFKSMK